MLDLTVIVPVYNVESYLERCINSIIEQTIPIKKILLIDDGSTDGSGAICDEFARKHENISVIHQDNKGLAETRNVGMANIDTELIGFVDSDDYISNDMYEILVRELKEENADIAACGICTEKEDGSQYSRFENEIHKVMTTKEALIELNSYMYIGVPFWNKVFRRKVLEGIRCPAGKLCEDYYVMHKIIAKAKTITYTSKPLYHYIQRENSISRNKKINLAPMDASLKQLEFYKKEFPEIAYVAETACAFSHMGIYTAYVRSGQECPKDLLKKCKSVSKKYLGSVLKNKRIPKIKKWQALSFCYCLSVYKNVIKRSEHR